MLSFHRTEPASFGIIHDGVKLQYQFLWLLTARILRSQPTAVHRGIDQLGNRLIQPPQEYYSLLGLKPQQEPFHGIHRLHQYGLCPVQFPKLQECHFELDTLLFDTTVELFARYHLQIKWSGRYK